MTSGRGFSEDMRLAHVLADQADSISLDRFKALDLTVETKPDLTPVTDADRAVEEQLRITLSRARTRDAVEGEEFGTTGHGSPPRGARPAPRGARPDRRQEEFRPRGAGVGPPDRAVGRRRAGGRLRLRAGAEP